MTGGEQLDLEDAIAGAGGPRPKVTLRTRMKELREGERKRLADLADEIQRVIDDAKKPGTPLHKELMVRSGKRLVDGLFKKARALTQVTTSEPWMTAPTRERVAQSGENPLQTVAYGQEGAPAGVTHRWGWAVDRAEARGILAPAKYIAAARFRRAFLDRARQPSTMAYGEDRNTPTWRTPITRREAEAAREFDFVWERLEAQLRTIAWILVLQQPLPGASEPMSIVEFGQAVGKTTGDEHARGFAYGCIFTLLERLASIYKHFDLMLDTEAKKRATELCNGELGVRAHIEGWHAQLFDFCRTEGRLPGDDREIARLVEAAREAAERAKPKQIVQPKRARSLVNGRDIGAGAVEAWNDGTPLNAQGERLSAAEVANIRRAR